MTEKLSRRSFIKFGAAAACSVAAASVPTPGFASGREEHIATLLDVSKCIGCGECVDACSEVNGSKYPNPKKPFPKMYPSRVKVEDWSDKQDVSDRLTPYNWLFIQYADVKVNGEDREISIPRRCMHCVNPPCVKLCPWGAAEQFKNGISRLNPDLCLGGSKCKKVCPWDVPQRQTGTGLYLDILPSLAGNGVMYKCDRCYDRVKNGEEPACIEVCPEGVQTIGPRSEIIEKAYKLAKETGGYVYGDKENGGTNTIYVSPVPFDELNKAIKTGKGMPDLKPEPNRMASAENLTKAMFLAPLAGVAAAVGKIYASGKTSDSDGKGA
jgi:Fe-S-cluster-containing dehydrogenase component